MISGVGTHDYKEPMQEEVWYTPQLTKVAYRHGSSLWRPCCRAGSGEQQHQEEKEGGGGVVMLGFAFGAHYTLIIRRRHQNSIGNY